MRQATQTESSLHLRLYREMLRIRMIEEFIADRYPEGKMRCPVHLSIGQEAVAVATAAALRPGDRIVSTHRGHAHYLAKGGNLEAMFAEILGKSSGCSGGRGGSMNLTDPQAGVMLTLPTVGGSIPLGVGLALAERQQGGQRVVGIYLGDAALEEGVFHESANFAALKQLPVVFLCENNLYSVYTPLRERQPPRSLGLLAKAHAMPVWEVDGNNVDAVYSATMEAVAHACAAGPAFVLCETYRWREHCGPNYDNDIGYRTVEEFEAWRARSALELLGQSLRKRGFLGRERERLMTQEILAEIEKAYRTAEAAEPPPLADAPKDLYA